MSFLVVQHEFSVGSVADHISDEMVVALGSSRFIDDMSVVFTRDDGLLGEYPGIRKVWEAAQDKDGPSHIGYWHTKGASHPFNPCVHDWRRYMMYFFLRGPSLEHDVTGVDFMREDEIHIQNSSAIRAREKSRRFFGDPLNGGGLFPGNFWWASTEYLRKLPEPKPHPEDRCVWEFWIGRAGPTVLTRHRSNLDHYHTRYRPFYYVGRSE